MRNLTTNASLLTLDKVEALIGQELVNEVYLSVNGNSKDVYEKIMALPFEKVMKNLEGFCDWLRKHPEIKQKLRVRINTVKTKLVAPEVPEMTKRWEAEGFEMHVIDMDNRFDTYGLIRRSDICVTVCSQSGLEALMMGKEAVLLGDAYYGGLGFTHDVHQLDQLGPALHAALSPSGRRADPVKVAKFFYIFDQVYCAEKSTSGVADLIRRTLGRARLRVLPATA